MRFDVFRGTFRRPAVSRDPTTTFSQRYRTAATHSLLVNYREAAGCPNIYTELLCEASGWLPFWLFRDLVLTFPSIPHCGWHSTFPAARDTRD